MSHTKTGEAKTPKILTPKRVTLMIRATSVISFSVSFWPFSVKVEAKTGTNAWLKAPSANKRLNKLGIRKATLNASVKALAPKSEAMRSSLNMPVMRESSVNKETIEADLNKLTVQV